SAASFVDIRRACSVSETASVKPPFPVGPTRTVEAIRKSEASTPRPRAAQEAPIQSWLRSQLQTVAPDSCQDRRRHPTRLGPTTKPRDDRPRSGRDPRGLPRQPFPQGTKSSPQTSLLARGHLTLKWRWLSGRSP